MAAQRTRTVDVNRSAHARRNFAYGDVLGKQFIVLVLEVIAAVARGVSRGSVPRSAYREYGPAESSSRQARAQGAALARTQNKPVEARRAYSEIVGKTSMRFVHQRAHLLKHPILQSRD